MTGKEVAENTLKQVQAKIGIPTCPVCNNNNWNVADQISLSGTFDPDNNSVNPGTGIPGVNMFCTKCGFTMSFNPKILGTL